MLALPCDCENDQLGYAASGDSIPNEFHIPLNSSWVMKNRAYEASAQKAAHSTAPARHEQY